MPLEAIPFEAPGARTFRIETPGTYTLWRESAPPSLHARLAQPQTRPDNTPTIVMRESPSLREIPARRAHGFRQLSDTRTLTAVARWNIESAGHYEVRISGPIDRNTFAFGPSGMGAITMVVVGSSGLSLVGWAGSFAIVLTVMVRRTRFRRMHPGQTNNTAPMPDSL